MSIIDCSYTRYTMRFLRHCCSIVKQKAIYPTCGQNTVLAGTRLASHCTQRQKDQGLLEMDSTVSYIWYGTERAIDLWLSKLRANTVSNV